MSSVLADQPVTWDKVEEELGDFDAELYKTSLSNEDKEKLKASIGHHKEE